MKLELSEYEDTLVDITIAKLDIDYFAEKYGCECSEYAKSVRTLEQLQIKLATLKKPPLIPIKYRRGLIIYVLIFLSITIFSWKVSAHYGVIIKTYYKEIVLHNGEVVRKRQDYYVDEWFGATHYTRSSRYGKTSGQYDKLDRFLDLWFKLISIFVGLNAAFWILKNNRVNDKSEVPLLKGIIPLMKEDFVNDLRRVRKGFSNLFSKRK